MNDWIKLHKLATEKCPACGNLKTACKATPACIKVAQAAPTEVEEQYETYVTEEGETKRKKKKKPEETVSDKQKTELKGSALPRTPIRAGGSDIRKAQVPYGQPGFPPSQEQDEEDMEDLNRMVSEGKSTEEIAEHFGLQPEDVTKLVEMYVSASRKAQSAVYPELQDWERKIHSATFDLFSVVDAIDIAKLSGNWGNAGSSRLEIAANVIETGARNIQEDAMGHIREAYKTTLTASKKAMTLPEALEEVKEDFGEVNDSFLKQWVEENESRLSDDEKKMLNNYMNVDASRKAQTPQDWEAQDTKTKVLDLADQKAGYSAEEIADIIGIGYNEVVDILEAREASRYAMPGAPLDPVQAEIQAGREAGLDDDAIKMLLSWEQANRSN